MKKNISMQRITLLGLFIATIAAITAAILPKNETSKTTGMLIPSCGVGGVQQLTCVPGSGDFCTLTAGSGTTTPSMPGATSLTEEGNRTDTTGPSGNQVHNINSSGSPA